MTMKLRLILLLGAITFIGLGSAERLQLPGLSAFVSTAEARVGRPLAPVSYAGVARRTVRRCAVGVYNC